MLARIFLLLLSFPVISACQTQAPRVQVIPQPVHVKEGSGNFSLQPDTKIFIPTGNKDWSTAAEYLSLLLQSSTGYKLRQQTFANTIATPEVNAIYFLPDDKIAHAEGYRLEIKPTLVLIRARTAAGAFYAVQTLRQLFPADINSAKTVAPKSGWTAPCCNILDAPRFAYRGLHLDVSRHFFPISFIKKYIDLLAAHKLNTFHWHLTDDQGWRIEIKRFPELQSVAAYRDETLIGHYSDNPQRFDGVKHGGYYTQEEVKSVVEYAKTRFVTIVPEIEMPGHAMAALAAYPELGCTGGPYKTAGLWGVFDDVFCAGNDKTFEFIDGVLEEVCALFPGTYIHVGGDECPKTRWKECSKCQKRMKKEGLKDEHELQSYFIRRAEAMLAKHGKKLIGWDEILEGGIAPTATIMSWRGIEGGIAAAKAGHDAIMTPGSHIYLDHYQSDPSTEPLAIGGYLPIEKVYAYEPVPEELTADEAKYILGAQGNVWTEYMQTTDYVEYMAYPRVCALSEVVWTPKKKKNWDDFSRRLIAHFERMDAMGITYSKAFYEVTSSYTKGKVTLSATAPQFKIYYTTDGTTPTAASTRYTKPFRLSKTATVKSVLIDNNQALGKVHAVDYLLHKASGKSYKMLRLPDTYTGGEQFGLTNGVIGGIKSWDNWVGLVNHDIDPVIDLGKKTSFSRVSTHFVNSKVAWIYPPREIAALISDDGVHFKPLNSKKIDAEKMEGSTVETVELDTPGAKGRYLKLVATTFGVIPEGSAGAGEGAWLFLDEIVVE